MAKDQDGFYAFDGGNLDPDVESAIDQGRRRDARRKSPSQLRRAENAKARKAERDAARNRKMIDIPPDLERYLENMASELSVPFSSLAVYLLSKGLEAVSPDELRAVRTPTRSMRYEFVLPYQGIERKRPGRLR